MPTIQSHWDFLDIYAAPNSLVRHPSAKSRVVYSVGDEIEGRLVTSVRLRLLYLAQARPGRDWQLGLRYGVERTFRQPRLQMFPG